LFSKAYCDDEECSYVLSYTGKINDKSIEAFIKAQDAFDKKMAKKEAEEKEKEKEEEKKRAKEKRERGRISC